MCLILRVISVKYLTVFFLSSSSGNSYDCQVILVISDTLKESACDTGCYRVSQMISATQNFLYLWFFSIISLALKMIFMTSKLVLCHTSHEKCLQFIVWYIAFIYCFLMSSFSFSTSACQSCDQTMIWQLDTSLHSYSLTGLWKKS